MPPRPTDSPTYMPQIDGLRGLAIACVVLAHFPPSPLTRAVPLGYLGVQLFFVLSGFLITGILVDCKAAIARGDSALRTVLVGFYARRALRIFPVFYLWLLLMYAVDAGQVRTAFWYHAAYLTNFRMAATGQSLGDTTHFWSLAVEEQFYLLWPCLVLLVPARHLLFAILGTALCGAAYRAVALGLELHPHAVFYLPWGNLDALCAGAALAAASRERPDAARRVAGIALWCGAAGLALCLASEALRAAWPSVAGAGQGVCAALFFTGLVDRAARGSGGAFLLLERTPLVYLGKISYCVYVVHYSLPGLVEPLLTDVGFPLSAEHHPVARLVLFAMLAVAIAAISRRYVEQPMTRCKRRFPYRRPPATCTAAPPAAACEKNLVAPDGSANSVRR